MKYYWKLVRPVNLWLTVLTQALLLWSASRTGNLPWPIDWSNFRYPEALTTTLACLFIAAGGYVINDIFDIETDHVNRPEKLIISKHVHLTHAKWFYAILTTLGLFFGFTTGILMGIICFVLAVLLYFYSSDLKGEGLQGNLLIAMMAGMVVYVASRGVYNYKATYFAEFATMAFLITMSREVIKDIEDIEGDKAYEYQTFAVKRGPKAAKWLTFIVMALTVLVSALLIVFSGKLLFTLAMGLIIGYQLWLMYKLYQADEKGDFSSLSKHLKAVMFTGLLTALIC